MSISIEKMKLVEDIVAMELLRLHHFKIASPKNYKQMLNDFFKQQDLSFLKDKYDFLLNWFENNFNYESGSDEED
jgi:hypothetical protein